MSHVLAQWDQNAVVCKKKKYMSMDRATLDRQHLEYEGNVIIDMGFDLFPKGFNVLWYPIKLHSRSHHVDEQSLEVVTSDMVLGSILDPQCKIIFSVHGFRGVEESNSAEFIEDMAKFLVRHNL